MGFVMTFFLMPIISRHFFKHGRRVAVVLMFQSFLLYLQHARESRVMILFSCPASEVPFLCFIVSPILQKQKTPDHVFMISYTGSNKLTDGSKIFNLEQL